MLDIKFIRENKDLIKEAARKKHISFDVEELLKVDDERVKLLGSVEEKRAEQNKANEKISALSGKERDDEIKKMKVLKDELSIGEGKLKDIMKSWRELMLSVPNMPDVAVPEGKSDEENKELKKIGDAPKFSYPPKSHVDLMKALRMADFERGTKVSGFRGYFLKNDGALLSMALWQFVVDFFKESGYELVLAPSLVNKEGFLGTGYLPDGEEDLYITQDGTYLAGTGEVPVMTSFMDEVLKKEDLPKKIIAFSSCFRREAGSHGKDTKGLMRVHEFYKWEQVILCEASHEESVKYHEEITENAEKIMQKLEIPYRVVINCGGDLGLGQVKKYDIETWVPSENKYRETHSASYFHDFQTRRLNIKFKDKDGKTKFVHSLNSTALPTPRLLISIVENNQQKDGSILVPKVLQKYMGKEVIK